MLSLLLLVNGFPFGLDALALVSSASSGVRRSGAHTQGSLIVRALAPGPLVGGAGCRGVKGPVPQPLWMSALFAGRVLARGPAGRASHSAPPGRPDLRLSGSLRASALRARSSLSSAGAAAPGALAP